MKKLTLSIILCALFFSSCTDTMSVRDQIIGEWSMIKKSGGNNEQDCDFEEDKVVWTISENGLSIKNNDIFSTLCDAPTTANHNYILEEFEDDFFFSVQGIINGRVSFSDNNSWSIDGNFIKESELENQFIFSFSRPE